VVSTVATLKELPPIMEATIDPDSSSRAISSLSGACLKYDNEVQDLASTSKAMAIRHPSAVGMHYPGTVCNPIYQNHHHKMMNFQCNIIVHPTLPGGSMVNYMWDECNNDVLTRQIEEKKEMALKIKELEYRLETQKEKYEAVKEDLRDAKSRAQKAEWYIMKGRCALM
jgi:hypothetical protein